MKAIVLLLLTVFSEQSLASKTDLVGEVIDLKTNQKIYTELHSFDLQQGKQTLTTRYITPQQKSLGIRRVVFEEDRVLHYELDQPSLGIQESVSRTSNSAITISVKNPQQTSEQRLTTKANDPVVIDAGFSNFILRNWQTLLDGKTLKLSFASPAQMSVVRLQIKQVKSKPTQEGVAMFEMNIANRFIRLLLKPIKVAYYLDSKQLAYYKGPSNLKNPSGKYYDVEINFAKNPDYPSHFAALLSSQKSIKP